MGHFQIMDTEPNSAGVFHIQENDLPVLSFPIGLGLASSTKTQDKSFHQVDWMDAPASDFMAGTTD